MAENSQQQRSRNMGAEQDQSIAHIAEQSGADRTEDKRRPGVDAKAQQALTLPLRDLTGAHQFPARYPARRIAADHTNQDGGGAAARQAEQEPYRPFQPPPDRRPHAGTHQEPGQHQEREQRRDNHGGAYGQPPANTARHCLRPVQQRGSRSDDPGKQQCRLDTRFMNRLDKHTIIPFPAAHPGRIFPNKASPYSMCMVCPVRICL